MQPADGKARMAESGAIVPTLGPEYLARFVRSESARWQKVVQAANIKAK